MMKNNIYKNFFLVFISLDFILLAFGFIYYEVNWLLNTQVAFFSSLFITIASFFSYKRNVEKRVLNFETSDTVDGNDRDKLDEIEDPYDLYTEYKEVPEDELTTEKIKEIIKDEKTKVKRNSVKNTVFSMGSFLSIYRIAGYAFLIFGFFALSTNKIFLPIPFIIGLGVVPIGVLVTTFINNK